MKFRDKLKKMGACEAAVGWCGDRTAAQAYTDCERAEWMLWVATRIDIDRKLLVLAACACAETALKYVPAGEDRPRKAIETARAWCAGKATLDDVVATSAAAWDARDTIAPIAAIAASAASAASSAACAAWDARAAIASVASSAAAEEDMCAIVRKIIPLSAFNVRLRK